MQRHELPRNLGGIRRRPAHPVRWRKRVPHRQPATAFGNVDAVHATMIHHRSDNSRLVGLGGPGRNAENFWHAISAAVTSRSAAAGSRRVIIGAFCGLAATLVALVGFYFAESFVLDLGPHPWLTDLSLTMGTVV
jgi:hypothetical protein